MSSQFYSLKALQSRVQSLIDQQGEDAPAAAWIYTSEDVVTFDDDGNEVYQSDEICADVLTNLQDYDHIHTEIADSIDSELRQLQHQIHTTELTQIVDRVQTELEASVSDYGVGKWE